MIYEESWSNQVRSNDDNEYETIDSEVNDDVNENDDDETRKKVTKVQGDEKVGAAWRNQKHT